MPKRKSLVPYDLRQLDAGCVIELEHTTDRFKACRIAQQHLKEDHRYYSRLCSLWPKEKGCELVRSRYHNWPWAVMALGLGLAGVAWYGSRKG